MKYWDVLEGRGFLPSEDPLVTLFLSEPLIPTAYRMETAQSPQDIEWVLKYMDVAGSINTADEANLYRIAILFDTYERLLPGSCDEFRELLHERIGHTPSIYYVCCLNNWRRLRPDKMVHADNLQQITDFGSEGLLKLHVDIESRSVEMVRCFATVYTATAPDRMIRTVQNTIRSIIHLLDSASPVEINDTFGRCLSLRAIARFFGFIPEVPEEGLCEEHAKLFRRLEKIRQPMEGALADIYDKTKLDCEELLRKYSLIRIDR